MDNTDDFIKCIIQRIVKDYGLKTAPVTLSKMKKSDLVNECTSLGLPTTGSVLELKKSIKDHRALSGVKPSRSKKVKKITPVHNHPLSTEIHAGCLLCQTHGNVMHKKDTEYEMID
jgi:hypothetical protein